MFSSLTNKKQPPNIVKWGGYSFQSYVLDSSVYFDKKLKIFGIFILAKKNENGDWIPYFIEKTPYLKLAIFEEAMKNGVTHIHIATPSSTADEILEKYLQLKNYLIETYKPPLNELDLTDFEEETIMSDENIIEKDLNVPNDSGEASMNELSIPSELIETQKKLELLYKYQAHYLDLIKTYKEEIKFAGTLQEDLRRERSQFFTQTLKEVVTTMQQAEVDKSVSNKWLEELVSSYTRSLDLSGDLAKTHVIEILSLLTNEAKVEASKASLDSINKK